jgi:N-acetylglutamate synthase/N-acetylornithine aminotransferase
VAPTVGSLTWINQGTATASNPDNLLLMQDTGNNGNIRLLVATAANANFVFTARIMPTLPNVANTRVGICMRESATGKIQDLVVIGGQTTAAAGNTGTAIAIDSWTDATTFSGNIQNTVPIVSTFTFGVWLRMQYDGTNVISFVSGDGEFWYQVGSSAKTVSFTTAPNQYGACVSPSNSSSAPVAESIISWVES